MDPAQPTTVAEALGQAGRAMSAGDLAGAVRLYRQAAMARPQDASIRMQIATALRSMGDFEGALVAVENALIGDPYLLAAHLAKGFILEKLERRKAAAESYKIALKIAPATWPAQFRAPLERAREVVEEETAALDAFLETALADVRGRHAGARMDRFDLCKDVLLERRKVFHQRPVNLDFPQLPAIQFHDRADFPWLPELEAATAMIQGELAQVLAEDRGDFDPYIQYRPGEPVNQWTELNHSQRWSTFFLWKDGRRDDAHCARCPQTAALLERLPMTDQPGFAPTAMFSVLQPTTRIPPHTGSANTRLIVHLPLILPGDCWFRVGSETRPWRMGEGWVFDDTIEHEAWNGSDQQRVILIFDVWNPALSQAERDLVSAMMTARNAYLAGDGAAETWSA